MQRREASGRRGGAGIRSERAFWWRAALGPAGPGRRQLATCVSGPARRHLVDPRPGAVRSQDASRNDDRGRVGHTARCRHGISRHSCTPPRPGFSKGRARRWASDDAPRPGGPTEFESHRPRQSVMSQKHFSCSTANTDSDASLEAKAWLSSRQKPGSRFAPTHELALHERAIQVGTELRGSPAGLIMVQELAGPIGIPDVTALIGPQNLLEARLSLNVPPQINQIDAGIAAMLHPNRPRSVRSIAHALQWPEETVRRRVPYLLRSGALLPAGQETYVRPPELRPVGQIVAIEAKVKDWRKALAQARRYGTWADNYVIVMSQLAPRSLSLLQDEVRVDGGGLVIDDKWVTRPRKRKLAIEKRMWASEHFVAALVGNRPTSPQSSRSP